MVLRAPFDCDDPLLLTVQHMHANIQLTTQPEVCMYANKFNTL